MTKKNYVFWQYSILTVTKGIKKFLIVGATHKTDTKHKKGVQIYVNGVHIIETFFKVLKMYFLI